MNSNNTKQYNPVTLLRRLGAILYDLLLLITVLFIASFLVVIPFNIKPDNAFFFLYQVYIFIVAFIFFAWFWTHNGQTLGMRTWKIKVVTEDGNSVTWGMCLIRYAVSIISWSVFGLGFLWSLWDKQNRTWHDIVSGTKLIREH